MVTYVLRRLQSGNIALSKILNFEPIGNIIGRVKNNHGFVYNINVKDSERLKKHGSEMLNIYETLLKYNYGVDTMKLASWEKITDPFTVTSFYDSNGYQKCQNTPPIYFDDKVDIFEINQYFKKL